MKIVLRSRFYEACIKYLGDIIILQDNLKCLKGVGKSENG